MRIGKDGRTSELKRTARRWRKPIAQLGEKVWFRKIGEDGVSSFLQAALLKESLSVIMIEREQFFCITMNGVVRGKSWTRQTLSGAWDGTNWDGLCGTRWQMVANGGS